MNERELAAGLAETAGYRYADVVGDELFVAGQVPLDREGALVGADDAAAQAVACLDNLLLLTDLHGFALTDIRRITVHVVGEHRNLLDAWRAVSGWFSGDVPPATLLGAARLGHAGQLVEVDARVVRG